MKTKEEIELLAEKTYFNVDGFEEEVSESKRHWVGGYTQCQEDMKKETFTREELIQCMSKATRWDTFNENEPEYKMNMDEFFDYIIKQIRK